MTFLLVMFILFACSSSKVVPPTTLTGPSQDDGQLAKDAKAFDEYVHGKLAPDALTVLRNACHAPAPQNVAQNIFCSTLNRGDALDKRIRNWQRVVKPPELVKKVVPPVRPVFSGQRIKNWKALRKAKVENLLKGLEGADYDELVKLENRALSDTHCPNHIAVAVSAKLEDFLPDRIDKPTIAKLYEKGSLCVKKSPADRENYLTRAGLFWFLLKDYKHAESDFAKASQTPDTYTGRSLYWDYRALTMLGDLPNAKQAANQLVSRYPFSFHSLLVASEGSEDPGTILLRAGQSVALSVRSKKIPSVNPFIEQAEVLDKYGYNESATLLVRWALEDSSKLERDVKLHLAALGDSHTQVTLVPDVLAASPDLISRDTMQLLFPRLLYPLFSKNANGVDPYLLLSVAKQESTFNPKAVSPANAQGLLQLNPDTAKLLAAKSGPYDLLDPELNVNMGSRYLDQLIRANNGQIYQALAAYNAGQDKLTAWKKQFPTDDSILFIDLISYRETRGYVASVLRNYFWYRRLSEPNEYALKRIVNGQPSHAPSPTATPSGPTQTPAPDSSHLPPAHGNDTTPDNQVSVPKIPLVPTVSVPNIPPPTSASVPAAAPSPAPAPASVQEASPVALPPICAPGRELDETERPLPSMSKTKFPEVGPVP